MGGGCREARGRGGCARVGRGRLGKQQVPASPREGRLWLAPLAASQSPLRGPPTNASTGLGYCTGKGRFEHQMRI